MAYSRASHQKEGIYFLDQAFSYKSESLADWNINAINLLLRLIDVPETEIILSSSLSLSTTSSQRLVDLIKCVGGSTYFSGLGSNAYLDSSIFFKAGVAITYQNSSFPSYPQLNTSTFVHGLSIVDPLMMLGFEGLRGLLLEDPNE